jgi:hypothetical protein
MTYTICHVFEGIRPFDWLMLGIEVAVLIAILVFDIRGVRRERRHDKGELERKTLIDTRVGEMRTAMSKGQELLLSAPPVSDDPHVGAWAQAVSHWNEDTRQLLKSYSAHAETAFTLRIPDSPNHYGSIGAVFDYISLVSGLKNLQGIIEKPDTYFL